jgi:hypothetical protein
MEIVVNIGVVITIFYEAIQSAYKCEWICNMVLMQEGHPIAFESKKLEGVQLRWPTHEKELFVIVNCLKAWQHYLASHKTKVFTDNVSLKYFET